MKRNVLRNTMGAVLGASMLVSTILPVCADGVTELNYWTWFPSTDQMKETIENFEAENPDIKINMTVMESTTFQEKVPLALASEEDIDIIGVQPSEFATGIQNYLADLNEVVPAAVGDDWLDGYNETAIEKGNKLTNGDFKFITILNSGSVMGFYNASLLEEIGKEVPATLDEYVEVAEALHEKYPEKMAGVFAGMESWICDEVMLTILSQQSDYYNEWVYNGAPINSPEYIEALNGLKAYFDAGIFTQDIMDLDYASATEMFVNGDALVYYMGSWEAPLLSRVLREQNGIDLEDVGVMALPVVQENGKPTVRAYLDCGIGIVDNSDKKEAAAKFVAYCSNGEGVTSLAKQFAGTPNTTNYEVASDMLTSDTAVDGWNLLVDLVQNATSDRKNESAFASAVEGPCIQAVINGTMSVEEAVEKMDKEWSSGNY